MRDDLRQVELGGRVLVEQVADLGRRVAVRIGPSPERKVRDATPDLVPQLPRVLDATRRTDVLVTAEYYQCVEAVLVRPVRVRQAVVHRMLARQKRHDPRPRDIHPQIDQQVAEVVLLLQSNRAVGEEDRGAPAGEALDRVVGVDPRVHARGGFELRARRTQFGGDDGLSRGE